MSKYIDLTGQRFGKLVVLGKDAERSKQTGRSYVFVQCDCEAHTVKSIVKETLTRAKNPVRSCGCERSEKMSERMKANRASGADAYADMAGKTYGMLTVLSVDPTDSQKVVCMCQCKNLVSLQASYVLSGRTKSCGCQAQNTIIPNGTKYGSLTVVGNRVEKHQRKYICKCDCGKEIVTWKHNLERGLSSCGCQTDKSVYGAWQREQAAKRLSSLIGKRRGRLVCTAVDPEDPTHITVRCDCGTEKKIPKKSFTKPSSTTYSCGCFIRELSRLPKSKKAEYIEQFKAEYGL